MVGLEEGDDIFNRGIDLDVVCGADDVSAPFLGRIQGVFRHRLYIFGLPKGKNMLNVHPTLERDVLAEFLFQFFDIHIGGLRLEGLEDVEAAFDEVRDELFDVAAGVVHDRDAILVGDIDIGFEGLLEVFSPHVQAEQRAGLGADVIAHHEDVNFALNGLEHAVIVFDEVADNFITNRLDDLRVHDHIDEDLLDSPQVHHGFELGSPVQAVAHVNDAVLGMIDHAVGLDFGIVPPIRAGPVIVFCNLFKRL